MDSSDLNLAKQLSRVLKIKIFSEFVCTHKHRSYSFTFTHSHTTTVHGKEPLPTLDASEVQQVRKELVLIRDKVNVLLNAIDGAKAESAETQQHVVSTKPKQTQQVRDTTSIKKPERKWL